MHERLVTDAELVLLARAGEVDALGVLLERHRLPLYAAALALLGDRDAAMEIGVRAEITGLTATTDLTVLEIDFHNPPWAAGHCPPSSTFVHHLRGGRSARLDIYYHAC